MPTFYVYSGVREGYSWSPSEFLGSIFLEGQPSNGDPIFLGSAILTVKAVNEKSIIAMPRIGATEIGVQTLSAPENDRSNTVVVKQVHFFTQSGTFLESQPFTDEFLRGHPLIGLKVKIGANDQEWIVTQIKSDLRSISSVIAQPLDCDSRSELFRALEALRSDHNQTSDFIESLAKVILQQSYLNQSGYRLAELVKALVDRM